jgi:hypothetical protein
VAITAKTQELIEQVTMGDLSIEEAARRLGILATEPNKYHCGTCRFFKVRECYRPGQPPRAENALSARCGNYEYDDPRDHALPQEPSRGTSKMFK